MCCRYYMELSPELRPFVEAAKHARLTETMVSRLGKALKTEGDIRPSDMAPVIAPDKSGRRAVYPMIWGFVLPDQDNARRSRPLINARVESADRKLTFRDSWSRRRCVIPASFYFEWAHASGGEEGRSLPGAGGERGHSLSGAGGEDGRFVPGPGGEGGLSLSGAGGEDGRALSGSGRQTGAKYAIQPRGEAVTYLAGLYRIEAGTFGAFPHFTILTREPAYGDVRSIHDRMPVILPEDRIDEWINPATDLLRLKQIAWNSLTDMVCEKQL